MIIKVLTEHHLEFLSLKVGCTGSSESTYSKCHMVGNLMPRLILYNLRNLRDSLAGNPSVLRVHMS